MGYLLSLIGEDLRKYIMITSKSHPLIGKKAKRNTKRNRKRKKVGKRVWYCWLVFVFLLFLLI